MTDFHLCDEGKRLYMVWSALEGVKGKRRECTQARKAYQRHKAECMKCTDWDGVFRDIDRIAREA